MGQSEDIEHFRARGDEAELAASDFHVAVENHEGTEAGAVYEFDAGEIEDKSFNAVFCGVGDLGFDLAEAHAEGHTSGEAKDSSNWIDAF